MSNDRFDPNSNEGVSLVELVIEGEGGLYIPQELLPEFNKHFKKEIDAYNERKAKQLEHDLLYGEVENKPTGLLKQPKDRTYK
jgi:hypothetical protein